MDFKTITPFSAFRDLLESAPINRHRRDSLANEITSPRRHYHGLYHLATMWSVHRSLVIQHQPAYGEAPEAEPTIALAILYHDIVYDPTSKTNERDSALRWLRSASAAERASFPDVERLIMATADHFGARPADDHLTEWFVGLDLCQLAVDTEQFATNTALIRLEYQHVSDEDFAAGRGGFLKGVAAVPQIYRDPLMHRMFEKRARTNIKAALEKGG